MDQGLKKEEGVVEDEENKRKFTIINVWYLFYINQYKWDLFIYFYSLLNCFYLL